uniref:Neur_chan_memb domain-containing protein n=1 Tax=Ascaris lumbricoides TaxID=6252 RepID=A0A0M3I0V7_ASCLU
MELFKMEPLAYIELKRDLVMCYKISWDDVRSVVITAEAVIVTALLAMMPSAKTFMGTAFLTVALPAGT